MGLTYIGNADYDDIAVPVPGKSPWGIDTLTRNVAGRRDQLSDYVDSLSQGDAAPSPYDGFKLQTWDPNDRDPAWGKVTLQYKGLINDTIPDPVIENDIIEVAGTSSHYFSTPYDWGGVEDAVSAVMDYTYYAGQTVYRYITDGQNNLPTFVSLGFTFTFLVKRVRIVVTGDEGGTVIFGNTAPAGIASAVAPALVTSAIGYHTSPVFGTTLFECEDIVRAELVGS